MNIVMESWVHQFGIPKVHFLYPLLLNFAYALSSISRGTTVLMEKFQTTVMLNTAEQTKSTK